MTQSKYLKIALKAAEKAEEVIMQHFQGKVKVMKVKNDKSEATIADIEAEKIIVSTIKEEFPDHSFFGEELGKQESSKQFTWVIDPIDGTKGYINKIPLFGTQIALMKDDELILGISNMPAMGELLYAEKGKGAFCNGKPINVSKIGSLSKAQIAHGSLKRFVQNKYADSLHKLVCNFFRDRNFGDCYMYHLLATGKIEVVVEIGINLWDIAALKVIVEEAGGVFTDIEGKEISRDATTTLATNGKLYQEVLSYFKDRKK